MIASLQALLWGTVAGSALLLGSGAAWWFKIPKVWVCAIMAFGAGVLVSALSFELVLEAFETGGLLATIAGVLVGAGLYFLANRLLDWRTKKRQAKSGNGSQGESSGTALAVGALIDGIPESVALGLTVVTSASINPAMLIAIFISNVPEGLASTAQMKDAGRQGKTIAALWGSIAISCGLAAFFGALVMQSMPGQALAFATAVAAGGILTMIADSMIPEAYSVEHDYTGLLVTAGFLSAFALHVLGG